MESACGTCENEEKAFGVEKLHEGHCLEDQGINGRKDIHTQYKIMVQFKDENLNGTHHVLPCFHYEQLPSN